MKPLVGSVKKFIIPLFHFEASLDLEVGSNWAAPPVVAESVSYDQDPRPIRK